MKINLTNEYKETFKTFSEFRNFIKKELGIKNNTFKSWRELTEFWDFFNLKFKIRTKNSEEDLYFQSESIKYIFALCELDGEKRAEILGITRELYASKDKAKKWRNSIAKKIHSDINTHPKADLAVNKLNYFYKRMKKNGK